MPRKKVTKEVKSTMEITAKRLKYLLDLVKPGIASRSALPITQHLAFANKQAHATNLEVYVSVDVPELNGDSFTVDHKALANMTKFFPADSKVGLFYKKPVLSLVSGSKEATLATNEISEWPPVPGLNEPLEYLLDGDELVEVLTQVGVSAAKEESRPILIGLQIHLGCDDNQVAAVDGFRLSVHSLKQLVKREQPAIFILPVKTAEVLSKLWKLAKSENREITLTLSQQPPYIPPPPEAPPFCQIHETAYTERRINGAYLTRWTHPILQDPPDDDPNGIICVHGQGIYPAWGEPVTEPKVPEGPQPLTRFAGAQFTFGDVTLHSQLLVGTFLNYAQLIPSSYTGRCLFDAERFEKALAGMASVANEGSGIIRLGLEPGNKLVMSCKAEEVGDMQDSLEATVELIEPEPKFDDQGRALPPALRGKIAFNAKYLKDFIKGRKGQVDMRISAPQSPGLFLHERAPERQVIMPMFLHERAPERQVIMPMFVQW